MRHPPSGNTLNEYIFFGGKRIAMLPSGGSPQYYVEDLLGTSRVMATNTGALCYDSDFYPYGGERAYTNSCPTGNNYKFEGKERDTETGNDDFGARYYSNRFGRWLSADWSSVPVPVPYASLTNPQTLNLYAMVSDDPETSADLDGHYTGSGGAYDDCGYVESHCGQAAIQDLMMSESAADADATQTKGSNQQSAASQNANQQTQNPSPTMQLQVVSSTVATDKNDGKPNITGGSIFQVKVSVSDVKDGSANLSVSLQTPDGKPISGPKPIIGLREGSDARLVPEGSKPDHGSVGRTAVIGITGNVKESQKANLVFTLSQGKNVIASAAQPLHLLQGSSSHSPSQMSSVVGGSRNNVDFGVP